MPEKKKVKLKRKKIKVKMLKKKAGAGPSEPEETPKAEERKEGEPKVVEEEPKEKELEEEEAAAELGEPGAEEEKEEKLEDGDEVELNYRALNKVLRHGLRFSNMNIRKEEWVECMGFLIGNVNDGRVEIKDAIPMVHGNLVEVEFQAEHYAKADEINQTLTNENWVVGWYHTHPGHDLFLSAVDKINQSGYQSLNSKAVALVFDPSKISHTSKFEEYIKIFRLRNPELREKSDFFEIKNVGLQQSVGEAIGSVFEASMLRSKDFPLVLEYGEKYEKPVPVSPIPAEAEEMEKKINEMRETIRIMRREIKTLHQKMEKHMASTRKVIDEYRKGGAKRVTRPKGVIVCEFCGYDSIMAGDKTCASCGKRL